MKVAVLMLSYNRFDIMTEALEHNVNNAGYPFDLFVWDNGSTDERVSDYLLKLNYIFAKSYIGLNEINLSVENIGISSAFNRMLSKIGDQYEAFVFMANDIKEPHNWLADRVKYLEAFPMSGMVSMSPHQVRPDYTELIISGMPFYAGDVIGQFMISKQVLDKVGAFREDFGEYGPIDNDYNYRCARSGFVNYYIPGMAIHMDEKQTTEYGYDKSERIAKTWPEFVSSLSRYNDPYNCYIPFDGQLTFNMKDHV